LQTGAGAACKAAAVKQQWTANYKNIKRVLGSEGCTGQSADNTATVNGLL
jgi:hypothetical protein